MHCFHELNPIPFKTEVMGTKLGFSKELMKKVFDKLTTRRSFELDSIMIERRRNEIKWQIQIQ